jgi:hypothetical protein
MGDLGNDGGLRPILCLRSTDLREQRQERADRQA